MFQKKIVLFCLMACSVSHSFSQAAKSKDSVETLRSATTAKDSAVIIKDNNKAHATLQTNTGIHTPSTTSGTMNSPVNPNSKVIIPFGQKKKKSTTTTITAKPEN